MVFQNPALFTHQSCKADQYVDEDSARDDPFTQPTKDDGSRPLRNSTITASEKAVFERIFKEISDDASKKAVEDQHPLESNIGDDQPSQSDAYDDLNAIFDRAIQKSDHAKQQSSRAHIDKKHPNHVSRNVVTALEAFAGTQRKPLQMSTIRGGEDHKKIQASVMENNHRVMQKIDEAKTDKELWNVLESEVFALIKQYESQKKDIEEQDKAKKPKRGRGRASKADQEAAAATEEKKQGLRAREMSFQEAEIQAILSSNYGDSCLAAMRKLRRAYSTSPYAMNLLPTIRRLGSISHVLAASVDFYNEVLFLLWSEYSDLHGMADLINEMGNQGIESNDTTLRVLKMVHSAKRQAYKEDKPMKLWWSLSPVEAGYRRVHDIAQKVYVEILQARARRAIEGDMGGERDEGEAQTERDSSEEASGAEELKVKRAMADEATIVNGGLEVPLSPGSPG
ncbi:MAG: hypothetical protein Q9166_008134 [cf. Caloplaca sp. 2 TL-2023]